MLKEAVQKEIDEAAARVCVLAARADTGEVLLDIDAGNPVSSASTIKVPILLAALEEVRLGRLSLRQALPVRAEVILDDSEVFEYGPCTMALDDLLYWMIVSSDNTATNVLIDLLGYETVNAYLTALGCTETVLARRMLDFAALAAGHDNLTSARDQFLFYRALAGETILTPALCRHALRHLLRQRSFDKLTRYAAEDIPFAHKTGGLPGVAHDAGVFFLPERPLYVGVFVTGAPEDGRYAKRLIGRIGRLILDTYA